MEGLRLIDADDGEELWKITGGEYNASGYTPDGNFLVCGNYQNGMVLQCWDPGMNRLWHLLTVYPFEGEDDVIIYRDGNILYGHGDGITLINSDGEEIWALNNSALVGGRREFCSGSWRINPMDNGGFAAIANYPGAPGQDKLILIF